MNEKLKTLAFLILAVLLALIAWTVTPSREAPEVFSEQGETFYPPFEPGAAASVEIVRYDADQDEVRHFLVTYRNKRWTIPSHQNYPADAEKQLGKVVSVVNGLEKGAVRPGEPKEFGTVSPLNTEATGGGRGTLVTLKDATGKVLSRLIIGDAAEDKPGHRFVRQPDAKRTYACEIDVAGLSTTFSDWVETDLLKLDKGDIQTVVIDNYRVDEQTAQKVQGDTITLAQTDGDWALADLPEGKELATDQVDTLTRTLDQLKLVGVRRKPEGLDEVIEKVEAGGQVTPQEYRQLQTLSGKGYYFSQEGDTVGIVSNEGELRVACDDGVRYRLLFGEILYGDAAEISAAPGEDAEETTEGKEHRYLFVRAEFDPSPLGDKPTQPKQPAEGEDTAEADHEQALKAYESDLKAYEKKVADGKERVRKLQDRFADWYYVIGAEDFHKLHLTRDQLLKDREQEAKEDGQAEAKTDEQG